MVNGYRGQWLRTRYKQSDFMDGQPTNQLFPPSLLPLSSEDELLHKACPTHIRNIRPRCHHTTPTKHGCFSQISIHTVLAARQLQVGKVPMALTTRWVSCAVSSVILYVDLDPQQQAWKPTNDDLGRCRGA